MIRAVLDANVLVPMFVERAGTLSRISNHWLISHFQNTTSDHILDEVERTWTKPYWLGRFPEEKARMAARQLRVLSTIVPLAEGSLGLATHPEDDLVLATVLNGHVEFFVTGDRQLQKLETIGGTSIVYPAVFLSVLDEAFPE